MYEAFIQTTCRLRLSRPLFLIYLPFPIRSNKFKNQNLELNQQIFSDPAYWGFWNGCILDLLNKPSYKNNTFNHRQLNNSSGENIWNY